MPPVLHVAFLELVRSCEQDLFARDFRTAVDERHHVLQLIAETKRAARLIKRGARPDATRKCLVKQPAIEHRVERCIRRSHFDRAEQFVPVGQHFFKRCVDSSCLAELCDDSLRRRFRLRFAEQKDRLRALRVARARSSFESRHRDPVPRHLVPLDPRA